MLTKACEPEITYGRDTMPTGMLGPVRRPVRDLHALHRQPTMCPNRTHPVLRVEQQRVQIDPAPPANRRAQTGTR